MEDKYLEVLQNIEFAIVETYREYPDISDYNVMNALEALIDAYRGEQIGRPPRDLQLSARESRLLDGVRTMCEWRLGREEPEFAKPLPPEGPRPEPIPVEEILRCLRKILKSVNRWNKEGGSQGYLNFIIQYIR